MGSPEIRKATLRDLPRAASVLVDAFSAQPLRVHMLPGVRRRKLAIASGDMALYAESVLYGTAYVALLDGEIAGVLSWLEPEHHPRTRLRALALDAARIPFLFCPPHGFGGFRLQPALDAFHRNEPSLYFTLAATSRQFQKRGIASALLKKLVERAEERGCSIFLETSDHKNLSLYRRFGFEVVDKAAPLRHGPEVFAMLRPKA